MDIRIGAPPPVGPPGSDSPRPGNVVEARVLAVRAPRRRRGKAPDRERRRGAKQADPTTGRVLVLMIPDGGSLPAGVEDGRYRVFLRFARR